MKPKIRILVAGFLACACLIVAAIAWAAQTLTIHASLSPDKLGVPTNRGLHSP